MDILIKAAAIAITGAVIGLLIKKNSPDMALMVTIALALLCVYLAADVVSGIVDFAKQVSVTAGVSPTVLGIVMKTVAISIITKFSSDVCRDAGQTSVASGVELVGAAAAMYISLPLLTTVLGMVDSII